MGELDLCECVLGGFCVHRYLFLDGYISCLCSGRTLVLKVCKEQHRESKPVLSSRTHSATALSTVMSKTGTFSAPLDLAI